MPSPIQIGNLIVEPYKYDEDVKDGALVIMAKAILTADQHEQVMKMQLAKEFIAVSREGIDAEPKQMIFGMPLWSEIDADYKHEIILSETKPSPSVITYWKSLFQAVAENKAAINALIEVLRDKDILNASDELKLNRSINGHLDETYYQLWRVEDVDEYEL